VKFFLFFFFFKKVWWPDATFFYFISFTFIHTIHSHILTSMNIPRGSSPLKLWNCEIALQKIYIYLIIFFFYKTMKSLGEECFCWWGRVETFEALPEKEEKEPCQDTKYCNFVYIQTQIWKEYLRTPILIKKNRISSYIRKFRRDRLQSHIWQTASSYATKYLPISSKIWKPFLIYDFAPKPLWITLYRRKIFLSFLSVHAHFPILGNWAPPLFTSAGSASTCYTRKEFISPWTFLTLF
jgi:hypothetical protein